MAINQKQVLSLQQKLSPQQIQMIKLLELPTVQLEQRIKQEIEENIVLEEEPQQDETEEPQRISVEEYLKEDDTPSYKSRINNFSKDDKQRPVYLSGGRSCRSIWWSSWATAAFRSGSCGWRSIWSDRSTRTATCAAIWYPLRTTSPLRWASRPRPTSWSGCSGSSTSWSPPVSGPATCASACCCRWSSCP